MKMVLGGVRPMRVATISVMALAMAAPTIPVLAQDSQADARLRRIEAEVKALQRQVFPGGDGKYFSPEITPGTPAAAAQPATPSTTPVTDLLARMEAVEAQIARLTAQVEDSSNKIALIEARLPPVPVADPVAAGNPGITTGSMPGSPGVPAASDSNLSAMTGGAAVPRLAAAPQAAPQASPAAKPAAKPAAPSAARLTAVRAIVKPETGDPGDDEYTYGFRLWDAKFYPEAQQQLKLMIDKYPRHAKISYARNLLGRAYLDDNKPRDAAAWFLQNYQNNQTGARASESLLLLAESMRRLNDKNRACISLTQFAQTYPADAVGRLKSQYDTIKAAAKCT